jgi:hypothetical protein
MKLELASELGLRSVVRLGKHYSDAQRVDGVVVHITKDTVIVSFGRWSERYAIKDLEYDAAKGVWRPLPGKQSEIMLVHRP